jgi:hypothetical protein
MRVDSVQESAVDPLPIRYDVAFYEGTLSEGPSLAFTSEGPLPFAVGQWLDHYVGSSCWRKPPPPGMTFRVAHVQHSLFVGSEIHHRMTVLLEIAPYPLADLPPGPMGAS